MKYTGLFSLMVIAITLPAFAAQTDWSKFGEEYKDIGDKAQSAFECAALAEDYGDYDEFQRLLKLGYEEGQLYTQEFLKMVFVDAGVEDSDITMEDALEKIIGAKSLREYAAFYIGQEYKAASNNVDRELMRNESYEQWQASQKREYHKRNCSHLKK